MKFLNFSGMPFIPSFPHSLFLAGSSPHPCLGLKLGQSEEWVKEFQAESGMNRCSKAAGGRRYQLALKKSALRHKCILHVHLLIQQIFIVLLWEIRGAWHSWGSTDEQKKLPQQMYNYRVRAQKKRNCSWMCRRGTWGDWVSGAKWCFCWDLQCCFPNFGVCESPEDLFQMQSPGLDLGSEVGPAILHL